MLMRLCIADSEERSREAVCCLNSLSASYFYARLVVITLVLCVQVSHRVAFFVSIKCPVPWTKLARQNELSGK